ncbi:MAG: D-alanine--D-alanine ligase [Pirellulales bacterium]|nr:D-alanine--D-alanine ligase [Pirellulales bacterium]
MSNRLRPPSRQWQITVLCGGPSAEREISLSSGRAVAAAIRELGHWVIEADITPDDLSALDTPADIIFPVLHGRFGEDGQLQEILEQRGLTFVGSGSEASRICIDKDATKRKWKEAGLPTAPWVVLDSNHGSVPDELKPPFVVKPLEEGSSIGIHICDTVEALHRVLPQVILDFGPILVEQWLEGPELTVGVLGHDPLPVIQVHPAVGWYDYAAKYERDDTDYFLDPGLDRATYQAIQHLAVKAFDVLGCLHLARIDLILDRHFGPQLLEINTIPGFTDHSLLPKAAAHLGISFPRLVEMLLEMAWDGQRPG